jgi:hypothetical protein
MPTSEEASQIVTRFFLLTSTAKIDEPWGPSSLSLVTSARMFDRLTHDALRLSPAQPKAVQENRAIGGRCGCLHRGVVHGWGEPWSTRPARRADCQARGPVAAKRPRLKASSRAIAPSRR